MSYSRYEKIRVEAGGGVLRISLDNPEKRNIIDDETNRELGDVFVDAAFDPDVRVVLLTGKGKVFSAGGDIVKMQRKIDDPALFYRGMHNSRRLVFSVLDCPKPVVCKVNGDAVGLGATLALLCDLVVANEDARFLDPHVGVGLVAGDGGALIWPQLIGFARARRHLLLGEPVTGRAAAEMGLIAHACPLDDLDAAVEAWVAKLAAGATQSISGTKTTINVPLRQAAQALLDVGMAYEGLSNISRDHQEAVTAFMEKRKPAFKGD